MAKLAIYSEVPRHPRRAGMRKATTPRGAGAGSGTTQAAVSNSKSETQAHQDERSETGANL
jgi:hypothetical protein